MRQALESTAMSDFEKAKTQKDKIAAFKKIIWEYYHTHKRAFAWRDTQDPYHIVVSEIMLQQTQTERVKKKYADWIKELPTFESLASAPLNKVLSLWQGLGYNRRGIALKKIAEEVINKHNGIPPNDESILQGFPGIGKATAGSIVAFAFNKPSIFIETNIRRVFIHFCFPKKREVHDDELYPLIAAAVDKDNAREWYYALMDYGVMLKQNYPNPNKRSAHYTKQSRFEGSERQIRGMILRALLKRPQTQEELIATISKEKKRVINNLNDLIKEGFVVNERGSLRIS